MGRLLLCATMRRSFWITSVQVLLFLTQISCDGIFQLKLLSYNNEHQLKRLTDVSCLCSSNSLSVLPSLLSSVVSSSSSSSSVSCPPSACVSSFRICLSYFTSDKSTQCATTILHHHQQQQQQQQNFNRDNQSTQNSAESGSTILQFPFNFSWPGTFTLTIEASHGEVIDFSESENTTDDNVFRLTSHNTTKVGNDWIGVDYFNRTPSNSLRNNPSSSSSSSSSSLSLSSIWLQYAYRVICDDDYYGPRCVASCKPRNDKFGHYICDDNGDRVCIGGWQGTYCETAICLPGCHVKHGMCDQPNECKCRNGWQGKLCTECILFPGCQHGTCQKPWRCDCLEGWGGLFCNQDLMFCSRNQPCRNGSTCLNSGQGSYTCICPPGATGRNCDVELNACQQLSCLNGGTCFLNGSSERCECNKGFRGVRCESPVVQSCSPRNPCSNGGACLSIPPGDDGGPEAGTRGGYACVCASGFTGSFCEVAVSNCLSNPCQNGATCTDGRNGYQCRCAAGFEGPDCQTDADDCLVNPCLNGGTCVDRPAGDFECRCPAGFVGTLCEDDVDECLTRPCANGGVCLQRPVNDFACHCAAGFAGRFCTVNVDECASGPCRNAGTCVDRIDRFECRCADGFYGTVCQNRIAVQPQPPALSAVSADGARGRDEGAVMVTSTVKTTTRSGSAEELSERQGGGGGGGSGGGMSVSPLQQVLLIVCFGFGIPSVVVAAVFLLWIYRRQRHHRCLATVAQPQTALNNRRPADDGRHCFSSTAAACHSPDVVTFDAENCQISCAIRGHGDTLDFFPRRLNADEIAGVRASLREARSRQQQHHHHHHNNLRDPLSLTGGFRDREREFVGGDKNLKGLRNDRTSEEDVYDWSDRQAGPSTEKTPQQQQQQPDESLPEDSPDFRSPVPGLQDIGHQHQDFVCSRCAPWSAAQTRLQFARPTPHCRHQIIMATDV